MRPDWRGYVWPVFLYGLRPWLVVLRLIRCPQRSDSPFTELDPIA